MRQWITAIKSARRKSFDLLGNIEEIEVMLKNSDYLLARNVNTVPTGLYLMESLSEEAIQTIASYLSNSDLQALNEACELEGVSLVYNLSEAKLYDRWKTIIEVKGVSWIKRNPHEMQRLVKRGCPDSLRRKFWLLISYADDRELLTTTVETNNDSAVSSDTLSDEELMNDLPNSPPSIVIQKHSEFKVMYFFILLFCLEKNVLKKNKKKNIYI